MGLEVKFGYNLNRIPLEYQTKGRSSKFWRVTEEIKVTLTNGDVIIIPEGFETDLSSVPRWLWSFLPPFGIDLLAYLIHDYLYHTKQYPRKFTDREMYEWACMLRKDNTDPWLRFRGVQLFGGLYWKGILKL